MLKYLHSFFYSQGKPQPIYFWVTVFLFLFFVLLVLRVASIVIMFVRTGDIDVPMELLILVLGYVISLIGLYNLDRWKRSRKNDDDFGGI